MRKDEERCYLRYLFEVDGEEEVIRVELIPTIGNERLVYARTDCPGTLRRYTKIEAVKSSPEEWPEDLTIEEEREYEDGLYNVLSLQSTQGKIPDSVVLREETLPDSIKDKQRKWSQFITSFGKRSGGSELPPLLSELTLIDRLEVSDPIVRDAFDLGTTAEQLFMHYKLVKDSGERC